MYARIRRLLFRLDPETAHGLTLQLVRLAGAVPPAAGLLRRLFAPPDKPVRAFGLTFCNPVGLAAGYDKDGLGWRGLVALGFGHIEVGTVTPRPQPGNPRPRLFRLPQDQALINRMGFPGKGAAFVARQLQGPRPPGTVLGVNLGKNKDTPLERAVEDYLALLPVFTPLADYLAINVSSPNTPDLRRLQGRQALDELLGAIQHARQAEARLASRRVPLLVKLAPDLTAEELDEALDVLLARQVDGVIATNTTVSRSGVRSPLKTETGGLSGAPLSERSLQMLGEIVRRTGGKLPVIAAGGVMNADDARRRLDAGAKLVQVYTGLVYRGPSLVKEIAAAL